MNTFYSVDFSSSGTMKTVLRCITHLSTRPKTTNSSCTTDMSREGKSAEDVEHCASDLDSASSYDSDSLAGTDSAGRFESMDALDTPLSWCCRGDDTEFPSPESSPVAQSPAPLLDSHVFVLFPRPYSNDFDFTCAGEERRPSRRSTASCTGRNVKTGRPRRSSAPYFLQSMTIKTFTRNSTPAAPPSTSVVGYNAAGDQTPLSSAPRTWPKQKPGRLHLEVPSLTVKARGVNMHCASNKWGKQPPAGYI